MTPLTVRDIPLRRPTLKAFQDRAAANLAPLHINQQIGAVLAVNDKIEALEWAAESYNMLLAYAKPVEINIVIENHGGVSNDPDWMISLLKKVNDPSFGTFPDWRNPSDEFDNYTYLRKTAPYAKGMSYRNQPTEELTAKMIEVSHDSGYRGWYGIESKGREEVTRGISLLKKYLLKQ